MNRFTPLLVVALVLLPLPFSAGCKKKEKTAAVPPAMEEALHQPGASEVMAAIDKKDYDSAVAQLMAVRQAATTEEAQKQFALLAFQARDKLAQPATTDPKAAEALSAIRALSMGR